MPNRKLTDLPTLDIAQFTSNDLLYIVDAGAADADASKKITYANLVGNDIVRIDSVVASFSAENVGDITFLSGGIDSNKLLIDGLTIASAGSQTSINGISAIVDNNFAIFELLSADVADINLTDITLEVQTLCTYTDYFKSEIGDGLYDVKYAALTAYTYVTRVSALDLESVPGEIGTIGSLATANKTNLVAAINELHGEVDTNNAKVGITTSQANAITDNTNNVGLAIPLATLKTAVAGSADFAAFKTAIAAL